MGIKFSNLASTTLASSVTSSATSITVADGSVFPTLSAGDYFYATIDAPPSLTEIVKVTARSGNTLTVVRAQDNTTATTHASGDEIALRVVSAVLEDIASAAATESVSISGDTMTGDLTVGGNLNVDGSSGIYQRHSSGGSIVLDDTDTADASTPMVFMRNTAGTLSFGYANRNSSTGLTTGSTNTVQISPTGIVDFINHIDLPDNKYVRLGNDADLILYHNGTGSYIQSQLQDADIHIRGNDGGTNFNALSFDMSAAGAATFNANVKVKKQLLGGFNSVTTSGTLDWNHVTNARAGMGYSLLQGGDLNGPELGDGLATSGGGSYYHITSWEYSSTDGGGNLTQVAIPYHFDGASGKSALSMRSRYNDTWTGWYRYIHLDVDAGTAAIDGAVTADNYLTSGYLALSAPSTANNYALVDINDSTFDFQLRQYNGSSWVTSLTIDQVNQFATFSAGASFAGSVDTDGLSVSHQTDNGITFIANDTTGNSNFSNVRIDYNVSGSDTLTGDRSHIALEIDVDSSASGGDTSNEHRVYGIHNSTKVTGDSDLVYGGYFNAEAQQTTGQVTALYGLYGRTDADAEAGTINGSYGVLGTSVVGNSAGVTHTAAYGVFGKTIVTSSQAATSLGALHGGYFEVELDEPGANNIDVSAVYGVRSMIDNDDTSSNASVGYDLSNTPSYLFYGDYTGTLPGNPYGLYILDDVPSYIRGKLGLGTTNPTRTLTISSDDDLGSFTGTSYGAMYIRNSDYSSGEYSAIDFGYSGTQNPVGRIALRVLSGGSRLSFGTSSNYSNGVTNLAMTIGPTGLVGIGTDAPGNLLEVAGASPIVEINATSGVPELQFSDGGTDEFSIMYDTGEKALKFGEGGVGTHLTIEDGGKVGIGTTAPAYRLDVDSAIHIGADGGSGYTHSRLIFDSGGSIRGAGAYFHNRANDVEYFAGSPYNDADSFAITRKATALHAESTADYTNALMTIDGGTGYMGIGTTNPLNVIDLGAATGGRGIAWGGGGSAHYASIWTEYSTASLILGAGLKGGTDAATFLNPYTGSYGYAAIELDSFSDDGIKFYVAPDSSRTLNEAITPVEVMRIDTGGDVLIGTTTQVYGSARLNIGSTSDATNAIQIQNSTSGNGYVMFGDGTSTNAYRGYIHYNHGSDYLRLRAAGSERLRCDSGGVNVYGELLTDSELYFNTSLRVGTELVAEAQGTVGPGWMTVATNTSGRRVGEIIVTDADSGDHTYVRIDWMRSYADSNFTVLNCGGHSNRITGVRVISQDSNNTYGIKLLQVYVTHSSDYEVSVYHPHGISDYTAHTVVTPVIENTKTGYSVHGGQIEDLDDYSFASEEGIQSPQMRTGAIYANTVVNNNIDIQPAGSGGYVTLKYAGDNTKLATASSGVQVFGSVTEISDESFKVDVQPIQNALATVTALKGVTYSEKETGNKQIGFIAQDIEKDAPDLAQRVVQETDPDSKLLGLNYSHLTSVLAEAIKEQQVQIEQLSAEIKALKEAS